MIAGLDSAKWTDAFFFPGVSVLMGGGRFLFLSPLSSAAGGEGAEAEDVAIAREVSSLERMASAVSLEPALK